MQAEQLRGWVVVVALVLGGCTKPNPEFCEADAECLESARPFCDVGGEFEESGFSNNTCSARPEGCSVERCGCTAGETSCSGEQLSVCNANGRAFTTTTCALGCAPDGVRCYGFEPSNDLGGPLADAAAEPDVVLPAGVRIDTGTGLVTTSGGATVTIPSRLVSQGASMIRVFMAKSFVIDDAKIVGPHAFAAVSPGPIIVKGRVDASADRFTPGPGAVVGSNACVGQFAIVTQCGQFDCAQGAGGGGNAHPGGGGGGVAGSSTARREGGAAQAAFSPLVGGCSGGNHRNTGGGVLNDAGGGGGAIQLVSNDSIDLIDFGLIDLGAGGGDPTAGGGAGGTIVLESPTVRVSGPSSGIAANGGAGGGCTTPGPDATPTSSPALGPSNCNYPAGNGGTGMMNSTDASYCVPMGAMMACFLVSEPAGGAGGSAGRARIVTKDGLFEVVGSPLTSVLLSTATLTRQ